MMDLAVELEWRTDNPVKGVKRYPTNPDGYHSWDEGEIERILCFPCDRWRGPFVYDADALHWGCKV